MTNSNPYNIVVGGYAPCQGDGYLPTGEHYYVRSRGKTSIDISSTEESWWKNEYLYSVVEEIGYMPGESLIEWATNHINKYLSKKDRNFITLYEKLTETI